MSQKLYKKISVKNSDVKAFVWFVEGDGWTSSATITSYRPEYEDRQLSLNKHFFNTEKEAGEAAINAAIKILQG